MANENLINDFSTTLNGGIDDTQTSIIVTANTTGSANFRIRIEDELMLVTANGSTTWTVSRGIEGTTPVAHADLTDVYIVATSAGMLQWLTDTASSTANRLLYGNGANSLPASSGDLTFDPSTRTLTTKGGSTTSIMTTEWFTSDPNEGYRWYGSGATDPGFGDRANLVLATIHGGIELDTIMFVDFKSGSLTLGGSGGLIVTNDLSVGGELNGTTLVVGSTGQIVGILTLGGGAAAGEIRVREPIASGSNYTGFKAQAMAGNLVYVMPAADGASGAVLTTDGALTLSWASLTTSLISEGSNLYYTDERVDDRVAVLIQNGTGISWSYDDPSNTLTPTVSLASFSTSNLSEGSNLYFTDERAQDAVGGILVDSTTIDFTYNDGANTITADVIKQMSITADASGLKLVNDATSPGNDKYYGTDSGGTKGFFDVPGASSGLVAGMTMGWWSSTPPTGWLLVNGDTIGDGSSGADHADAAMSDLFTHFWDNLADTEAPVSSGRGASAAADFAAHKTLTIPDFSSKMWMGAGTGSHVEVVTNSEINTSNEQITVASNDDKWTTTMQCTWTTSGTPPTTSPANLLNNGVTVYVIRVDSTHIQLASTLANAQSGTAINITAAGSGTFTLTGSLTTRTAGVAGGWESHALRSAELVPHTHTPTGTAAVTTGSANGQTGGASTFATGATHSHTVPSAGANNAFPTQNPYMTAYAIVKY